MAVVCAYLGLSAQLHLPPPATNYVSHIAFKSHATNIAGLPSGSFLRLNVMDLLSSVVQRQVRLCLYLCIATALLYKLVHTFATHTASNTGRSGCARERLSCFGTEGSFDTVTS